MTLNVLHGMDTLSCEVSGKRHQGYHINDWNHSNSMNYSTNKLKTLIETFLVMNSDEM